MNVIYTRERLTRTKLAALAALIVTSMGVGTKASADSFGPSLTAVGAVIQQAGHVSGAVNLVNDTVGRSFPAAVGDVVHVTFNGVTDNTTPPAATPNSNVPQPADFGKYLTTFCGNYTDGLHTATLAGTTSIGGVTGSVSEVQVIAQTGNPRGGTYSLTFADPRFPNAVSTQTTGDIPVNANAATVQAALNALDITGATPPPAQVALGVPPHVLLEVTVAGGPLSGETPLTITFVGGWANFNAAQITTNATKLTNDHPLVGADVSSLDGVLAHCAPLAPVAIPAAGVFQADLTLSGIKGFTPASPGSPAVAAVVAADAVIAGSITPGVTGQAAVPCDPLVDIPTGLLTPPILACSITPASPAVAAVAPVPPVSKPAVAAAAAIPAVPATPEFIGTRCQAGGTVIPCLMLVASTTQNIAFAIPIVNPTSVQVVGRNTLAATGKCNPTAAPPTGCPATRISTTLNPYPIVFGGGGFAPSNNAPAFIGCVQGNAPACGGVAAGDSFTSVAVQLCDTAVGTGCLASSIEVDATAATPAIGVNASGQLGGPTIRVVSGTPGDRFVKTDATHFFPTGGPVGVCPLGTTPASPIIGICSFTQTAYAPVKILVTTGPTATNVTTNPYSGGTAAFDKCGTVTPVDCAGAAGVEVTLKGHNFEPRSVITLQRLDGASHAIGDPITVVADGVGDFVNVFAGGELDSPAASVHVSALDSAFSSTGGFVTDNFAVKFDPIAASTFCSNTDSCNAGVIITTTVDPGNVQLFTGENEVVVPNVDLSTIDITDETTWYPFSDDGPIGQVLFGDMRGANSGVAVTGSVQDLIGSLQRSNTIPAVDVFALAFLCEVLPEATVGVGSEAWGIPTAGADDGAEINPGDSLLAAGEQEFCSVLTDATGREGGIYTLDASLQIAGRPNTAADDYTGLLTITITGQ